MLSAKKNYLVTFVIHLILLLSSFRKGGVACLHARGIPRRVDGNPPQTMLIWNLVFAIR